MRRFALAAAFCLGAAPAFAVCPTTSLTFKDAAGTTQTLCFGGASGAFIPQYQILDSAGTNALTVTAAGAAKVDGSAVTQPVSGTVTANAGTNLNTSALALDTSVNGLLLAQGSTTAGQSGPLAQGAVTTGAPTYTTAQTAPLSIATNGNLRVAATVVGGTVGVVGTTNNNADAVATQAANAQAMAYLYGFNGTTWDRLRVDASKNLNVNLSANSFGTLTVGGTVTANQGGAPWADNVAQFGGTNISTGTGASGAGIPRVTVSNDSNVLATQSGTWTVQPGNTQNTTGWLVEQGCAGQTVANTTVTPISITASTRILTGVASKKYYVCSINLVAGAADNVALVEGTGTVCATGIAGMAGGTTAATGWNLAANGGLTLGAGTGLIFKTATAADDVCLLVSSGAQVSGSITTANF